MKVSTKGRYGLRILLDVALNQERGPVALSDISKRQAISHKYLWQVINPLKAAGLLTATRGTRGGYLLAKRIEDISILDVVNILEGPVAIVPCIAAPKTCERNTFCTTRDAWHEIQDKINEAMAVITLKQLVTRHHERESRSGQSYDI
jgi:Rrf2 family protein